MRKKKEGYLLFLFLIFGLVILLNNIMTNGRYYTNVNVSVKPNFASTYFNINKADAQENYGISPGGDVTVHYNLTNKENTNINTNKLNFYLKVLNETGNEAADSSKITVSSVKIGGTSYSYVTGKGYGPVNNLAYNGTENTKTFDIILHCANSYVPSGTLEYKVSILAVNPEDTTKYVTKTANLNIIVEQEYTVTFNSNGGSDVSVQTVNAGNKVTKPADPTKQYNNFLGWYKEDSLTNLWDFNTDVVTGNTTLYAKWETITYTVSFNTNGGTLVTSQTVNGGTLLTEPTSPTKSEGYIFDGWYKESTLDNLWNFSTDIVTENKTLYAKWAEAIYFQMPPDWYGTTVYAYIHRSSDSIKDGDLPKNNSILMTLKDSSKKIYQYKLSQTNIDNISTYNKVIFYNDGDLTNDDNLTERRTIAVNLTNENLRKVFVPELYSSSTEMRLYGYASTLYEYLWKEINGVKQYGNNDWPGIQMTGDTVDGQRFHQRIININTYNRLIINQGKGNNQSENITIPKTYGSNVIAQDLTFKIGSTKIKDQTYNYKIFRCVYNGSWHTFDTWNSTEYSTWNSTGDGAKFRAAQAALGYK